MGAGHGFGVVSGQSRRFGRRFLARSLAALRCRTAAALGCGPLRSASCRQLRCGCGAAFARHIASCTFGSVSLLPSVTLVTYLRTRLTWGHVTMKVSGAQRRSRDWPQRSQQLPISRGDRPRRSQERHVRRGPERAESGLKGFRARAALPPRGSQATMRTRRTERSGKSRSEDGCALRSVDRGAP